MSKELYLFHGKGGSPNGSVRLLESVLQPVLPGFRFTRPELLHHDPDVLAELSLDQLPKLAIPEFATIIGISLGGLIAARFQEESREDLTVICISSPTWADGVRVQRFMPNRLALFSSTDEVIHGRTADWPILAESYDIPALTHDTDRHVDELARRICLFLKKEHSQSREA